MFLKSKKSPDTSVEFKLSKIDAGHHKITYRGINCAKCPFDYVLYQMIISEIQPDLIIEIGSNEGGSAVYLADLLEINGKGLVHTIDIEDRIDERARIHSRIRFFSEGWQNYDLNLADGFEVVLVIEDSSHTYTNTLAAITHFAPVVSKGSYLIVEDGIIDALGLSSQFGGGPVKAIKEFLDAHPEFTLDTQWSDFFGKNATFNTIGYLKRSF